MRIQANKARIVIDARMVEAQGHGIALYLLQLADGLSRRELPYETFYLISPHCPADSLLRRLPHRESSIPFLHSWELFLLGREVAALRPALYHTPSFASLLRNPCPVVQTVHDLNHLHFGGPMQKFYYRWALLPSARRARTLLSVSETAAFEIRGWLLDHGVNREVGVAPNAILAFPGGDDAAILRRHGLESGNYFFCLSNPKPHKNLALLERAYAAAREIRALPPLAISLHGAPAPGLVHTGPLGGAEVGALLRHAKAFYFPSLYEGFGRPPVEAALEGTIPVASSLAVHREALAGVEEAIFLDPASESLWKENFLRMANVSDRVSEKSREWIRKTWSIDRLCTAMDRVYREALGLSSAV